MEAEKGTGGHGLQLGTKPEDIHVLLVDDERLSRVVVGNLLRKCNYQGTRLLYIDRARHEILNFQ